MPDGQTAWSRKNQKTTLGPRGVPGKEDPAKMTPQREKKTPKNVDPGHTA